MEQKYTLEDFVAVIKTLRGENGCPWDRAQTHESLRKDLIEEAYEAVNAIDKQDMENLCEELGDVLMQVVFHARIEEEKGEAAAFTLEDILRGIGEKMIRRHPHVFGGKEEQVNTPEDVLQKWEVWKQAEKESASLTKGMQEVPEAMPALMRAEKVQKKAASVGFDFLQTRDAFQKVYEEIRELEAAVQEKTDEMDEEFGDVLFSLVNVARFLKINPEFSLTKATKKFINRFESMEKSAFSDGKVLSELSLEEMDLLWDEAKILLRSKK